MLGVPGISRRSRNTADNTNGNSSNTNGSNNNTAGGAGSAAVSNSPRVSSRLKASTNNTNINNTPMRVPPASDRPNRRAPLSHRSEAAASAAQVGQQWWRGLVVGATIAFALSSGWGVLRSAERGSGGGAVGSRPDESWGGDSGSKDENVGRKRCPVFNGVTGEITVPSDNPPEKIEGWIRPGTKYPIESPEWRRRVYAAKAAKSKVSKGASSDEIGRAALSNQMFAPARPREKGIADASSPSDAAALPAERQHETKRGGIAAVLTLLAADSSGTTAAAGATATPPTPADYHGVLGTEWRVVPGGGDAIWTGDGGVPAQGEEVIVCRGHENVGSGGGSKFEEAWREASDRGAVRVVECGDTPPHSDQDGEQREPPAPGGHGELQRACAASDIASAEWLWLPGPAISRVMIDGGPDAVRVVGELYRLATQSQPSGAFGVMGWTRSPATTRSGAKKEKKAFSSKEKWHLLAGGGDHEDEQVVTEADALTDGVLVRGGHLRTACGLIRNSTAAAVVATASGADAPLINGEMKLSAISYVLRRTIGVRSYVAHTGAPGELGTALIVYNAGGGSEGKSGAVEWSWMLRRGGSRATAKMSSSQFSVPGSELLPWECLMPSSREAVLLAVGTVDDLRALKPLLLAFHASGVYDPYVILQDDDDLDHGYQETLEQISLEITLAAARESNDIVASAAATAAAPKAAEAAAARAAGEGADTWRGQCGAVVMETPNSFRTGGHRVNRRHRALSTKDAKEDSSPLKEVDVGSPRDVNDPGIFSGEGSFPADYPENFNEGGESSHPDIVNDPDRSFLDGRVMMMSVNDSPGSGGEGFNRAGPRERRWMAILKQFSPVAVLAVGGRVGASDTEEERAARRACARAKAPTSYIRMPVEDAVHATWVATLAPEALASWARPRFSVSVITNDRPESLQRLLTSLLRSRLFGDELAVDFYVESSADDKTLSIVEAFSSQWGKRGPVQTHFRVLKGGLIRAVTESFYPSDRHHHGFLFEDDIEVSPHFFAWAKYATLTYQYGAPEDFARDMYGVSLYTPRVNEIFKKRYTYDSNEVIAKYTKGKKFSPYLHQTPCSWGAVYFPESWMEYRLYLGARLREDHILVNIQDSKTNRWKTSWKRFYIEMAFQAEYYMLYPNFFNQTSFATNWLEAGEHIKEDTNGAAVKPKGDKGHRPVDYTVPLMEDEGSLVSPLPHGRLPSLGKLPLLNVLNNEVKPPKLKRQKAV